MNLDSARLCSSIRACVVSRVGITTIVRRLGGTPSCSSSAGIVAGPTTVVTARLTSATAASIAGIIASIARMMRVHPLTRASAIPSRPAATITAVTAAIVPRYPLIPGSLVGARYPVANRRAKSQLRFERVVSF